MKKTNTELMKELKAVQEEMDALKRFALEASLITYYEGEEEPERLFDYNDYIGQYNTLLKEERRIKKLLSYSNATTKLYGYDSMTIGEGLVTLAQLTKKLDTLKGFKSLQRVTRTVYHAKFEGDKDRVYIAERLYDPKQVDTDIKAIQSEMSRLQVAIDRTNLTNLIDC